MENVTGRDFDVFPKFHGIITYVIMTAVAVTGIFGNTLLFLAYWLSRRLQTKTNIFVINLATADMLTCVFLSFSILLGASGLANAWLDSLCAVHMVALFIFTFCSMMTLAFISVNRYVLITKSKDTYERIYRKKFMFFFLCISWLFPILFVTTQLFFGRHVLFGYDKTIQACTTGLGHPRSYLYEKLDLVYIFIVATIIVYSYGRIYKFLRRHNKKMQNGIFSKLFRSERDGGTISAVSLCQTQVNITKNLFFILLVFIICFGPLVIIEALQIHNDTAVAYSLTAAMVNSCVNPAIYGVKHPHFRQVLYCILSRRWSEIPEPAYRWMRSGLTSSVTAGSRSKDLGAISITVLEKE
ncbi:Rhodopsin, GQ-coupled [Holothuria leucospilota]|uniref:Rhodopsin, GQ-coupled n=1 Tax=Holothuria leucospilota TaxID=206669 RepID=A0A9Q1BH22_HOLLE|nr:Rhodopsin, GQ-coupled [Holothuria leucospilota]